MIQDRLISSKKTNYSYYECACFAAGAGDWFGSQSFCLARERSAHIAVGQIIITTCTVSTLSHTRHLMKNLIALEASQNPPLDRFLYR